jgi:hypothetical protein
MAWWKPAAQAVDELEDVVDLRPSELAPVDPLDLSRKQLSRHLDHLRGEQERVLEEIDNLRRDIEAREETLRTLRVRVDAFMAADEVIAANTKIALMSAAPDPDVDAPAERLVPRRVRGNLRAMAEADLVVTTKGKVLKTRNGDPENVAVVEDAS